MYTRQLPAGAGIGASGHSPYGGYPNSAGYGAASGFSGPVTYIYQPVAPTNTVAIVGMVLSLVAITTSFAPAGIAGIVMGHIARKQIRRRGERGDAMALTALWVGYVGTCFWLLFWLVYFGVMVLAIMLGAAGASAS